MSDNVRAPRVVSMAAGTLTSRITGLLRVLVLAYVLGFTPLADAFNLANTVPNMLFDLVLGGVMSATFIPVFVERLTIDGERKAWRSISTVATAATALLVVASGVGWLLAPWVIDAFTFLGHAHATGAMTLTQEKADATTLLRWFVPQIFFYGIIGIFTALLNVRHKFGAPTWVPVANNVVCMAVLVWFHLVDPTPSLAHPGHNLGWLALGTTAGVALQALLLVPSLLRADLWRMRVHIDRHDPALRQIARLGSWTLAVVLTNQAALYVVLAFAVGIPGTGNVSAYTYGWAFMQMPYAVVVVSVLNALTPQLSGLSTLGDREELGRRLAIGLRQSLVIIVPLAAALVVLAQPVVGVLLHHGRLGTSLPAGTALAVLAAGLPGFTVFQVTIRGLQSMQRAHDTFWLYLLENGVNITLAILMGRHSLGALCATVSIAYTVAAVAGLAVLRARGVRITGTFSHPAVVRAIALAILSALAMALAYNVSSATNGVGLLARLLLAVFAGLVVYGSLVAIGHRRQHARRRATLERGNRGSGQGRHR